MNTVTRVTCGNRGGKRNYALELAEIHNKKVFIATAEPIDSEMQDRINKHKEERGKTYQTIEEPINIATVIKSIPPTTDVVILDCLTVWLGNLQYRLPNKEDQEKQIHSFLEVLKTPPCDIILVTNELGMGIVPENQLARHFRDAAGRLNQDAAALANRVVLLVSGIPVVIKDNEH